MDWATALSAWRAFMTVAGSPPTTIGLRCYHLSRVASELGASPATLATTDLVSWLAGHDWLPATRRSYRSSLRAFYRWALDTGLVDRSPAHALPPVRVPRGRPRPTPEQAFIDAVRAADPRTRLALLLTGACGLRRTEAAQLRRADAEPALTGHALRVTGKGGHVRLVPMAADVAALVLAAPDGWLFPSVRGGHLTPHHLGKIISRALPPGFTTHSNRHRAGTQGLRAAGGNLRVVQEFLGHAKPETTAIYTLVQDDEIRKVVDGITPQLF